MKFHKNIQLSSSLKKEIARYAISFFFAWLVAVLINDFPFFKRFFIQNIGLDTALTSLSINLTETLLNVLGFFTYSNGDFLQIQGTPGLIFAYGCLGFREIAFFVVFIVLQYGKFKHKLWYISSGIILLIILNVIRALLIALAQYNNPENTELIHTVISPIIMYPAVLFLWLFWLYTFGKPHKGSDHL